MKHQKNKNDLIYCNKWKNFNKKIKINIIFIYNNPYIIQHKNRLNVSF